MRERDFSGLVTEQRKWGKRFFLDGERTWFGEDTNCWRETRESSLKVTVGYLAWRKQTRERGGAESEERENLKNERVAGCLRVVILRWLEEKVARGKKRELVERQEIGHGFLGRIIFRYDYYGLQTHSNWHAFLFFSLLVLECCLLIGNRHQVLQVCFGWPLGRFYGVIARSCSSFIWFLVNINLALFKLSHENTCNHVLFSTRCSFDFTHPHQGSLIKMWSMACLISFFVSTLYALFWLFSPISGICPWCASVFSPLPVRARDSQRYIFRLWVWKATTSSSMGCAWDGWDGICPHDCVEAGILKPEMVVALDRVDSLLESSQWWRIEV